MMISVPEISDNKKHNEAPKDVNIQHIKVPSIGLYRAPASKFCKQKN